MYFGDHTFPQIWNCSGTGKFWNILSRRWDGTPPTNSLRPTKYRVRHRTTLTNNIWSTTRLLIRIGEGSIRKKIGIDSKVISKFGSRLEGEMPKLDLYKKWDFPRTQYANNCSHRLVVMQPSQESNSLAYYLNCSNHAIIIVDE